MKVVRNRRQLTFALDGYKGFAGQIDIEFAYHNPVLILGNVWNVEDEVRVLLSSNKARLGGFAFFGAFDVMLKQSKVV